MQKRMLLFYSHQQLHSDMLVQPTRFPGTAGMRAGMLATAPTQPSIRQWAISGVLPYIAHQNTDPADQELQSSAGHQGLSSITLMIQHLEHIDRLIRLHAHLRRSAAHSAIAIFR